MRVDHAAPDDITTVLPTKIPEEREGLAHTVEVTAESLYEAVAQGLAALRGREWVAGLTNGTVKVSVADVRVEHEVKMAELRSGSTVQAVRRER